jgi:rhodanese-related sulfurtransferase
MTTISPVTLFNKMNTGDKLTLLDVRTPREYACAHVPGAILEPLESFDASHAATHLPAGQQALYVICQSGTRARNAIAKLENACVKDCVLVEGGTTAWMEAGLPVEREQAGGISLERQVRIAAGSLVFIGTLLALFVHTAFLVIPGFVGTGLIFAGVTDICGMGMLLARMPWNQLPSKSGVETSCSACSKGVTS